MKVKCKNKKLEELTKFGTGEGGLKKGVAKKVGSSLNRRVKDEHLRIMDHHIRLLRLYTYATKHRGR